MGLVDDIEGMAVLSRRMTGFLAAVAAALTGVSGVASADPAATPDPPPPPPVNSYALVKPSDFAVLGGDVYAFTAPGGLTCVMSRPTGRYGCHGAIPNAPDGANTVVGDQVGPPVFSSQDAPIIRGVEGEVKPLPANSRISFKNVTCGTDGTLTTCQNSFDQSGFVLSPAGSFILNESNPLLDRPEGTNPYFN